MFYLFTGTPFICDVALIRPSVRTGAPSPSGKALLTRYNFAGWYHLKKPSPGGKVDAKRTDEGDLPNGIGCVSTEHRLMRNH